MLNFFENSDIDIWYAHNGGKYDTKYLFEEIEKRYVTDLRDISGSLLLKAYKSSRVKQRIDKKTKEVRLCTERVHKAFELRDSLLLLPDSLESLTKEFNVSHKKLEYTDYEEHKDKELMYEYLKYDCIGLFELLDIFKETLGIQNLKNTIASTAMSVFKDTFGGSEWLKVTGRMRDKYRYGHYGGRTEVFQREGHDLFMYDINSQYPAVMYTEEYPIGMALGTRWIREGFLGYYKVRVTVPDNLLIPLLPFRDKRGKLLFPSGTFEGWYYSPELEKALALGYELEVLDGIYWPDSYNPFRGYIEHFYEIKARETGAKRQIAKLMLNSLYGKFAQKGVTRKLYFLDQLTKEEAEYKRIMPMNDKLFPNMGYAEEKIKYSDFIRPQYSGFITSYARVLLYEYFESAGLKNVLYCDTDSLVTLHALKDRVSDKKLGDIKLQAEIYYGIFLGPKIYAYVNRKGEYVLKFKGMNVKNFSFPDYQKALKGDISHFIEKGIKMAGWKEKWRRGILGPYHEPIEYKKEWHGEFDKRILLEDGIKTAPLVLAY